MFYNLVYPLADVFSPFNLFRYLTFRSIASFLTALVLSFVIGGGLIRWLRSKQGQGQPIREDGPASHIVSKKGTPTMGGLLILIALSIATLLWADLTNRYVWCVLGITVTFGAIGLWDDFLKVTKRNPKGVPGKLKLLLAVLCAGVAAWFIAQGSPAGLRYTLALPFLKDVLVPLGIVGFMTFSILVIVGTSTGGPPARRSWRYRSVCSKVRATTITSHRPSGERLTPGQCSLTGGRCTSASSAGSAARR